jgi:hypothetical protein
MVSTSLCIREVWVSNLGTGVGYPDWGLSWFSGTPTRQIPWQGMDVILGMSCVLTCLCVLLLKPWIMPTHEIAVASCRLPLHPLTLSHGLIAICVFLPSDLIYWRICYRNIIPQGERGVTNQPTALPAQCIQRNCDAANTDATYRH